MRCIGQGMHPKGRCRKLGLCLGAPQTQGKRQRAKIDGSVKTTSDTSLTSSSSRSPKWFSWRASDWAGHWHAPIRKNAGPGPPTVQALADLACALAWTILASIFFDPAPEALGAFVKTEAARWWPYNSERPKSNRPATARTD